jgi:hypothetical protein
VLINDYCSDEIRFAYCYHAYIRWCTYCLHPYAPLSELDLPGLQAHADRFGIKILECQSGPTDVRVLVSLQPHDTLSGCASKLKGQTSKWLREALRLERPTDLLARGYFSCTTGKSTQQQVDAYLGEQSAHHGYSERNLPPVYVRSYRLEPIAEARLQAQPSMRIQSSAFTSYWQPGSVTVSLELMKGKQSRSTGSNSKGKTFCFAQGLFCTRPCACSGAGAPECESRGAGGAAHE